MKLKQVAKGMVLHWPEDSPMRGRIRGREGYVVDLDGPEEAFFLAGQDYKLVDAAEGSKPSKISDHDALAHLLAKTGHAEDAPPSVAKVAAKAREEIPAALDGIPEPETPKKEAEHGQGKQGRRKRQRTA